MARRRKRYTPEQIITMLREAEVLLSQGKTVKEASKLLEIAEQTYYLWRREYGAWMSHRPGNSKRLKKKKLA